MQIDKISIKDKKIEYQKIFKRRKKFRITAAFVIIFIMIIVALIAFPSWVLFGMPKLVWAPFFYLLMFGYIIGIVLIWRCPSCKSLLGDMFNTKYCSQCGLKLVD